MKRKPPKKSALTSIRIIAGRWRGRKLPVVEIDGLRPTGDRIRETLFNWLDGDIAGARCLDLFAGSGVLGFEALSRGAAHVTALDASRIAVSALVEASETLETADLRAMQMDAIQWLASKPEEQFDLVFIDPPFQAGLLDEALVLLEASQCLREGAVIYIERDREHTSPQLPEGWRCYKDKVAGNVSYGLYTRDN
ncbi:16S rRNA (guanine(966)-N(2))-methyltransferase RsmD [Pseudomonadales bacterium]|nr:16S rRNA (guanine(966)-N(2))-methyltransferase RsmD [Pseudomonadales bacterium]